MVAALRARGAGIREVRYRENRTVLLSLSRDGRTLNSHVCFREAPARIMDAIAVFLRARPGTEAHRRALETIRSWDGALEGLRRARRRTRRNRARRPSADPTVLRELYDRYNQRRFGGRLPRVALRVSKRMTRTLGTISYSEESGVRGVREIAIAWDLLLARNRRVLEDTLLHEMAHAEAWLRHGHRGHGREWRRVAERVGCTPRALIQTPMRRG